MNASIDRLIFDQINDWERARVSYEESVLKLFFHHEEYFYFTMHETKIKLKIYIFL